MVFPSAKFYDEWQKKEENGSSSICITEKNGNLNVYGMLRSPSHFVMVNDLLVFTFLIGIIIIIIPAFFSFLYWLFIHMMWL
jgi:hypothetical protein